MSTKGKPFHETVVPYFEILINMWTTHATPIRDNIFRHDLLTFVEHMLIPTIIPSGHQEIAESLIEAYDILFFGTPVETLFWDNKIIMRALRERLGLQLIASSCEDMHGCWPFDEIKAGHRMISHNGAMWEVIRVHDSNEDNCNWKYSLEIMCTSNLTPVGSWTICLLEDGKICRLSDLRLDGTVAIVCNAFCDPKTGKPRGRVIIGF